MAARQARGFCPDDPQAFVISAWGALAGFAPMLSSRERSTQAAGLHTTKRLADPAAVLDDGTPVADVPTARGLATFAAGDPNAALAILEHGAAAAEKEAQPYLYFLAVQDSASVAGVIYPQIGWSSTTDAWLTVAENHCFGCLGAVGEHELAQEQRLLLSLWEKRVWNAGSIADALLMVRRFQDAVHGRKLGGH